MVPRRLIDLSFAVAACASVAVLLLSLPEIAPARFVGGLLSLAILAAAYVFVGRAALVVPIRGAAFAGFIAVVAIAMVLATWAAPALAMLQSIAYPLIWMVGDTGRGGVLGSVVIAAAVFVGMAAGGGFSAESVVSAAITALLSVVFSIWFGLWISSIVEYGKERARLLTELTAAQSQLELLHRDRGAAEERERLARDLHDTVTQSLAGLVLITERALRQSAVGDADGAQASLRTIESVAREALDESRALVARTAAVPTDDAAGRAVERLVERFRRENGAEIRLTLGDLDSATGREAQVVLLRCLQESLSNVQRHAHASRVDVSVQATEEALMLEVCDDGRGFDADAPRDGYGIDGMIDRVALGGGHLDLRSDDGGTRVRIRIPAATPSSTPSSAAGQLNATPVRVAR